ncbi:MAG TPA: diaminopimelate decarboxylase [Actinospica sp.]|nr:diaminopimelate decarboxylase [Actinospica sp.]
MAVARRKDAVVREVAALGLLSDDAPLAGFIDLAGISAARRALHAAFADVRGPVLHTFAAKAASLVPVLRRFAEAGMGCEAASPGELAQALAAGFPPDRIVLDSPAKTRAELRTALRLGVAVNADNFEELARTDEILRDLGLDGCGPAARPPLGLRINPQVGAGSIGAMSTATEHSKFGVPLRDAGARAAVIDAFARYPWLNRLHLHVGSQGCPLELIARGVRDVYELAEEINALLPGESGPGSGRRRVTSLDLGGGLPVDFADDRASPAFAAYAQVLRAQVPGLFDGRYALVTEFGRSLVAKNGFTLARVEYVKEVGGRRVALTHAGAQVATRTVFMPESWPLRLGAYDADGLPKRAPVGLHDVAGPLCFAGDLLASGRELPMLESGDLLLLHDTGGYYFTALWTYNSLPRPAVYGFEVDADDGVDLTLLRPQQTLEELVTEAGGDFAAATRVAARAASGA